MTKHRINISITSLALVTIFILTSLGYCQQKASDLEQTRKRYDSIASRLDTGGDFLVVANVEDVLKDFVGDIIACISVANTNDAKMIELKNTTTKISSFLQANGFYAVNGFGMSVVPQANGLNTVKTFIGRDAEAASLPLWRSMVGFKAKPMSIQDFLPKDTVFARTTTAELKYTWQLVKSGVKQIGSKDAAMAFEGVLAGVAMGMGVGVDNIIASIGNESFFSIQLSSQSKVNIPSAAGTMTIPEPAILLGMKVNDDTLEKLITTQITNSALPVIETNVGGTTLKSLNLPIPSPVPIKLTYASHKGFFLLGSTLKVVSDAVSSFDKKTGLVSSAGYKKDFSGLPTVNNGIVYINPRFSKEMQKIQEQALSAQSEQAPENAVAMEIMMNFMRKSKDESCAMVVLNTKEGILTKGTSTSGSREMLRSMSIAPLGILAGITLPAITKARSKAQGASCINNLRQIDAAKEQWAMATRQDNGAQAEPEEIKKFLRGGRMPVCSEGGTYKLNAIGADPECSVPGHKLQ